MAKQLPRFFSVFVFITFILSACSGNNGASSAIEAPLRVGWSLYPGWYPMAIAVEKGFFEKHGVQVEPVFFSIYKEQTPPLASGQLDGAAIVLGDVLLDNLAGNIKVVMITDNSDGADQLMAAPGIVTADDIRGKKIGMQIGTFGELLVREMLAQKGISPSEVTFIEVAPELVPNAIPNTIDIGHTFEPFSSQARAKGFTPIFTSADAPGLIVDVFAFRRNVIQERPKDIKAFVAAWFEAVKYWQDNPAEGNAIIAKATGQKVEDVSVEGVKLFDLAANLNSFKPGTDTTSVYFTAQKSLQFLIDTGVISVPVKIDEVLDASFLQ